MKNQATYRREQRLRRHRRVRKKVAGDANRPRLAVYRTNRHISAQVIDDLAGTTLVAASTLEADLRTEGTSNKHAASAVGTRLAERAKEAGIERVVFDRGGYRYHGRVAALADAAGLLDAVDPRGRWRFDEPIVLPPMDAGTDTGPADAGTDAGPADAGTDAGPADAGISDAGTDVIMQI